MLDAVDICDDIAELSIIDEDIADDEVSIADDDASMADEDVSIIDELGIADDEDCASTPVVSAAARTAPTTRSRVM
ncbi:MAG TPA: hypothetical protein VG966_12660 [Hyphomicrobiaceae bacterium]|nr:hypothetical protein [Hyphomicrobiaceae bacterium]